MAENEYPERLARLQFFESKEAAAIELTRKKNSNAEEASKKEFEDSNNTPEGA